MQKFFETLMITGLVFGASAAHAADKVQTATETQAVQTQNSSAESAAPVKEESSWLWLGQFGASYSSTTTASGTSPTMDVFDVGFTAAWKFGRDSQFAIGLSSDFNQVNQLSDPASSGGNFTGTRMTLLAPTFGYNFGRLLVLADLDLLLGSYVLTKVGTDGSTFSYTNPTGLRVRALWPNFWHKIALGGQAEYATYSKASTTTLSSITLGQNQSFWQLGVIGAYFF